MASSYTTVAADGTSEIEAKRSRFIGWVRRVETQGDARAVVEVARKQMWDARHHCSAFVLGSDRALRRSNDDGEPVGTAGAPMLDALVRRQVSDVVAVVARYFGGTLLGAGGLVRAYSDAVAAALDDAGLVRRDLQQVIEVRVDHRDAGRLEHDLRERGVALLGVDYASDVRLTIAVPTGAVDGHLAHLAAVTAGAARSELGPTRWVDVP